MVFTQKKTIKNHNPGSRSALEIPLHHLTLKPYEKSLKQFAKYVDHEKHAQSSHLLTFCYTREAAKTIAPV